MAGLELSLLGPFKAKIGETLLQSFPTLKAQALLIYLTVERDQPHRREHLMELLWPNMPVKSAQVNLRQTLYRLCKATTKMDLLASNRQTVQLSPGIDLKLDVDEFQTLLFRDPEAAVNLYRGDFLSNFYLTDSNLFEEWAEQRREGLRRQLLDKLAQLAETAIGKKEYQSAQDYAWRQLEADPLREPAYRQLMRSLEGASQRNAALAQYQVLSRRLEEQLGLAPSPETTELYERIQAEALMVSPSSAPSERHSGMTVFMLTDIESSTRLWDSYRQDMLPALLKHNAILEELISKHGGRILELRGDGVKAVFEGADPLLCAIDIQKALAEVDWDEIGSLRIRIGLHGAARVREDFDFFIENEKYYGPVLNHTARIMDAGHGGQILVSESMHNTFSLPSGASWQDFGEHKVKSLDQPLQIYGLIHPDLPMRDFPPLRTGVVLEKHVEDPRTEQKNKTLIPHNLPARRSPFFGREMEQEGLESMLANSNTRLITIVGPGGMGKTSLAKEIGCRQLYTSPANGGTLFPDGVFFVPLASLSPGENIPGAISKALNLPVNLVQSFDPQHGASRKGKAQKDKLFDFLRNKCLLLILDNLEHLLDDIGIVADILEAAPDVHILGTSRERLRLVEEQVYPIEGLTIPEKEDLQDFEDYTAIALFVERARRLVPSFSLQPDDRPTLIQICRLLGGMPLGLELAASWIDILPLPAIDAEIQSNIDFLAADLRNLPERHRSLRAVLESTWKRVNPEEKRALSRMSVFRGAFTQQAAEQVAAAGLRTLSVLAGKSLLQYDREHRRFQLHEVLRQYTATQLEKEPEEKQAVLQQHSEYYCTEVANRYKPQLEQGTQDGLNQFELDSPNILAAWKWAVGQKNFGLIALSIDGLCEYYELMDQLELGRSLAKTVLDLLNQTQRNTTSDSLLRERLKAKTLLWLGFFNLGFRLEHAADFIEQAEYTIDRLMDSGIDAAEEKCTLLVFQGRLLRWSGNYDQAKAFYLDALRLGKEISLNRLILWALIGLADIAVALGDTDEEEDWMREHLEEARAQQNHAAEIRSLGFLGGVARKRKSYIKARDLFNENIELARKYHHREELILALIVRAGLSLLLGRFDQALSLLSESVAESRVHGSPYYDVMSRCNYGNACWLSGKFDQADEVLEEAVSIGMDSTNQFAKTWSIVSYSNFLVMAGRYQEASDLLALLKSPSMESEIGPSAGSLATRALGWIALAQEDFATARQSFERNVVTFQQIFNTEAASWSQAGLAAAVLQQGQRGKAKSIFQQALQNSIDMQCLIPLLHLLPFICLYYVQEDPEMSRKIYTDIQYSPFLAKAKFFDDTVFRHLPDEIKGISNENINPLPSQELIPQLWETASEIILRMRSP